MNIFEHLKEKIAQIVEILFSLKIDNFSVELPKNPEHGDLATNISMILAKPLNKSPIEIAEKISTELKRQEIIEKAEAVKPGFINITLKQNVWFEVLQQILNEGIDFGNSNIGKNQKVNIEFVSVNPTGPMHIGHSRGGIVGDALANLMRKNGYLVTKEFYINDAGSQISTLTESAYLRYLEAKGEKIGEIPEGLYPGEYLIDVGKALFQKYGSDLKDKKLVREFTISAMMEKIKADLKLLDVEYDVFFSEKTLHDQNKIAEVIKSLEDRNLVYRGVLEPPKGNLPEDWEPREQLLFRTTLYGDDVDRPLQKSNGEWTYAAADIAYLKNKIDRGFNKITMILGADHLGYKKRMQAFATALGGDQIDFDIKFYQLVNFVKDGLPYKMSKRKGTFVTIEDVVSEVGKDVVRFMMLTRRNDQGLDFDLEKVKEQSKDNPVFYVQYANSRVYSIMRNAFEKFPDLASRIESKDYILNKLDSKEDIELIKIISNWPKIVEFSCIHQEPHRIAFYLIELASAFHSFWTKGNDNAHLRFIIPEDSEKTLARLMLAKAVSITIESGLKIFNVEPAKQM